MSAPEDKWVWFDEPDPKPKDVVADVPVFVPPAPDPPPASLTPPPLGAALGAEMGVETGLPDSHPPTSPEDREAPASQPDAHARISPAAARESTSPASQTPGHQSVPATPPDVPPASQTVTHSHLPQAAQTPVLDGDPPAPSTAPERPSNAALGSHVPGHLPIERGFFELGSSEAAAFGPAAPAEDLQDLWWASPQTSGLADPFAPLEWPEFGPGASSHHAPKICPEQAPIPLARTEEQVPVSAPASVQTPPAADLQEVSPQPVHPTARKHQEPKPVEPTTAPEQPLGVAALAPHHAELKQPEPPQSSGRMVLTSSRPAQGRPELRPVPVKPQPDTQSAPPQPAARDAAQGARNSSALVKAILLHLEGKIDQALAELNSGLLTGESPLEIKAALGNLLYEAGRFDDAARNYRDVLAQQPQHPGIHYRLAVCLHRLERLPEALAEFQQAAALSQTDWEARLAIGVILLEIGNPAEALPRFEECVAARPREVSGLMGRGVALEQLGRILDAESTYRAALSLDPSSTEVRQNLLSICMARESTVEARKLATELLSGNPHSRQAYEALVTLEMTEGNYLKARDLCELLVKQEPEFFEAWFNYGICLRVCQNTAEAAAAFGEAARLKSDSLEAQVAYGIALREGGDRRGAAKVITDALERTPSDPRLLMVKAGLAIDAGDLEAVEKIVVGMPSGLLPKATVEALEFQYGCLLLETGDLSGAVRVFDACLKRRPDWTAARVNHALALWRSGESAAARKAMEGVLAAEPKRAEALSSLAYMAIEREDYQGALDLFLKLIAAGERSAEVFYNAGLLQQHFARPQEALDLYAEALKENPALSEALERMGQVAAALGRNDEAKEYWKKAKDPIILGGLAPA